MHPVGTGSIVQMYFKCNVPQNSHCVLIVEDSTESHCAVSHVRMPTGKVTVTVFPPLQYFRFSVGGMTDVAEIKGHRWASLDDCKNVHSTSEQYSGDISVL